ncbi:hypothetical protein WH96_10010 [Kiloniella spongiae]|uniref:TIR domain-containing protein n=1 Tax=Kiloniella spongiae TaxID=1489064 RepID=A0A0H2ME17_9PROT|nr:toll/interleukin-1 receptor domain-containing protein [Kiloniella spongiae]KLN60799.1 hypothetical protein WH96_10010 [Kiloniella spongiae]
MKTFISYSHKDASVLERLHTHLAPLKRDKIIETWYDRDILAGSDLDNEISNKLNNSELFLLLISPDFLASDYCYNKEMHVALEKHQTGKARVIPIIIEPCDWLTSPLRALKALPRDGIPVSDWINPNTAFLDITKELRSLAQEPIKKTQTPEINRNTITNNSQTRKYRVTRSFDEIDKTKFRDHSFIVIKNYFEKAIAEIDHVEGIRGHFSMASSSSFGCTVINKERNGLASHLTVHQGGTFLAVGDIYFSYTENAPEGSANGYFSIDTTEYDLFLKPSIFDHQITNTELSPESAAELLWTSFIKKAGIDYD